ncbi:uncharacterized protein [Salmo salar]|uniref:Uncharacterized protein n=1 Tax=Salmo salar TaxID=8030 RepID=A0A1S3S946_SALSA|nr:uncharacterized protein LOC106607906 [Salmo salar]|eukprot:XP_014060861.1 PREDICTED: uncharacterized protein LOC106607906 [Salmo salar]
MFATSVEYLGLRVPQLLQASEEEFGSDRVIMLNLFLILLLLLFCAIHLRKNDDDVFGEIDPELVNKFTEGVQLNYNYLKQLEELLDMKKLQIEDLISEMDLDCCSESKLCSDSCYSRSSSRSHSRSSVSSRSSDGSTWQTCKKRPPTDRFKYPKGCSPDSHDSPCPPVNPSPVGSPGSKATPFLQLPGGGDDEDSYHGSTLSSRSSSCSSSRYVSPSDSPLPLEYQPSPRQPAATGWRRNWTLTETKVDSVASPVAAPSTVTFPDCKDRAADLTDHTNWSQTTPDHVDHSKTTPDRSKTPTVRQILTVRQLFEVVPRKADPPLLHRWHRRRLELNATQKVARNRWRIAVLMISIVRWLLAESLKGGGTTSSTSPPTSTTTTHSNTSTTSQAKKGSEIIRKTVSVPAFCPQGVNPPSHSQAPCQFPGSEGKLIMMYAEGARIPLISQEVREKLESHVRRKQSQRLWGFPKLVTRYVGDLMPLQLPISCSEDNWKIMGNVTDHQAVFSGRVHLNTEFRLKNKTTKPEGEQKATAALAAAKDTSPATRTVEKTTSISTMLQPAETHATKSHQTRATLNQPSPAITLTPERQWLEKKMRSKCMEVKLKHFPGIVAQSYHSALAWTTSQPTRKPTQVAKASTVVPKCPTPLRQRDKVSFMDQGELRHLVDNLIMKHMEHLQRQGVTTPSTHTQGVTTASALSQSSHSLALETSTGTTVSHPYPALTKQLVLVNGLEQGARESKTLQAPQQYNVKPSSATVKVGRCCSIM